MTSSTEHFMNETTHWYNHNWCSWIRIRVTIIDHFWLPGKHAYTWPEDGKIRWTWLHRHWIHARMSMCHCCMVRFDYALGPWCSITMPPYSECRIWTVFFMFSFQSIIFQDFRFYYTPADWTIWSSKIKIPAHRAASSDLSPALSRASPSNFDSGFTRFQPPNCWPVVAPMIRRIDIRDLMSNVQFIHAFCLQWNLNDETIMPLDSGMIGATISSSSPEIDVSDNHPHPLYRHVQTLTLIHDVYPWLRRGVNRFECKAYIPDGQKGNSRFSVRRARWSIYTKSSVDKIPVTNKNRRFPIHLYIVIFLCLSYVIYLFIFYMFKLNSD